jgi:alpha-tubulin suppressor-like RCC1 family protein
MNLKQKNIMNYKNVISFTILCLLFSCFLAKAQSNCIFGCNDNAYTRSTTPNTIEYDNMISTFHATMVKESNGVVKIWGQGTGYTSTIGTTGPNIAPPQAITSATYPGLTGTILRMASASNSTAHQFAVLTTTGLFIWGNTNVLVNTTVKTNNVFGSVAVGTSGIAGVKADGLPVGVVPSDVKMMFGSRGTLAIVTCTGDAWVLSIIGSKNGDGTSDSAATGSVWHRVLKSATATDFLTNVVAIRGNQNALFALTNDGKLFTWGTGTYINNGASANRLYATEVTLPVAGFIPKMIGMTIGNTYYVLGTNGNLYSMGANGSKQLGVFSAAANSETWVQVRKSSAATDFLTNVVWISPQEHDSSNAAINILTTSGKLYAWGSNSGLMIGQTNTNGTYDPVYMPGSIVVGSTYNAAKLNETDVILAVETGGHTTIAVRQCSTKFGYVGHRVSGSMGNNTTDSTNDPEYNFGDTVDLNICGAATKPVVMSETVKLCPTIATYNLSTANVGTIPPGYTLVWYTTANRTPGTEVTNTNSVPVGNYYGFYLPPSGPCATPSYTLVNVSNYTPAEAYDNNCYCTKVGSAIAGGQPTKLGITNMSKLSAWPEAVPNGLMALESKDKGFVITRVANSGLITEPKKGMLVYDIADACVKLYNGTAWRCLKRSCNDY